MGLAMLTEGAEGASLKSNGTTDWQQRPALSIQKILEASLLNSRLPSLHPKTPTPNRDLLPVQKRAQQEV